MYVVNVPQEVLNKFNKIVCNNCKSTIAYNSSDIIVDYDYSDFSSIMKAMLGEESIKARYFIKCPICGEHIDVQSN